MFRYKDLSGNDTTKVEAVHRTKIVTASVMSSDMYSEIRDLYITAAQRTPDEHIDANVQVCNDKQFFLTGSSGIKDSWHTTGKNKPSLVSAPIFQSHRPKCREVPSF